MMAKMLQRMGQNKLQRLKKEFHALNWEICELKKELNEPKISKIRGRRNQVLNQIRKLQQKK